MNSDTQQQSNTIKVVQGNIVIDKESRLKKCIRKTENLDATKFEIVCNSPHEDEDYSYLCTNEYCRCQS